MRLFAILLVLLLGGLAWALWQGIDLGAGRLAGTVEPAAERPGVDGVELTAAEEGPTRIVLPTLDGAALPEASMPEPAGEPMRRVPMETAAEAPVRGPADAAAAPSPEAAPGIATKPAAPSSTVTEAAPALPDAEPAPQPPADRTAEAPVSDAAAPASEPAAPWTLPEEPLDPSDALASLAPDLATPAAPPVRPSRPPTPAAEPAVEAPAAPATPPAGETTPDTRRVAGDRVNLREGPDAGTDSLAILSRGDALEVLGTDGDWLRVRTEDDEEGWVAARFLAPSPG